MQPRPKISRETKYVMDEVTSANRNATLDHDERPAKAGLVLVQSSWVHHPPVQNQLYQLTMS